MGSDSAEDCGFIRVIKICSTTSFGGETKPAVPYRRIFLAYYRSLQYNRDTWKIHGHFTPSSRTLLLNVSAAYCL
jgi:hypothetical protein